MMLRVPNFGFDLDGCIPDTYGAFVPIINEMYGLSVTIDSFDAYNIEDYLGLSRSQILAAFDETICCRHETIKPYPHSIEVLRAYAKATGRQIEFITARPESQSIATSKWLNSYLDGIAYRVTFVDGSIVKSNVAKDVGIDVFVEDSLQTAMELANSGIHVLLLDRRWNYDTEDRKEITRIHNGWLEIATNYMNLHDGFSYKGVA